MWRHSTVERSYTWRNCWAEHYSFSSNTLGASTLRLHPCNTLCTRLYPPIISGSTSLLENYWTRSCNFKRVSGYIFQVAQALLWAAPIIQPCASATLSRVKRRSLFPKWRLVDFLHCVKTPEVELKMVTGCQPGKYSAAGGFTDVATNREDLMSPFVHLFPSAPYWVAKWAWKRWRQNLDFLESKHTPVGSISQIGAFKILLLSKWGGSDLWQDFCWIWHI